MGELALGEGERGVEVCLEVGDLLDRLDHELVDLLLVSNAGSGDDGLGLCVFGVV